MSEASPVWRCTVCGYIHHGTAPPDVCPVCGASADAFELYEEPVHRRGRPRVGKWRCMICSYVHSGNEPPETCPVCGAHRDRFEPLGGETEGIRAAAREKKAIIVGAGIAGLAAAESLRDASPWIEITLVGREAGLPYYRLNLTRYLAGEIGRDELPIHDEDWYRARDIHLVLGADADSIDLASRTIACGGESLPYTKLLLATGAHPFVPAISGADREGVSTLRTIADADYLIESCRPGARCVCVGGGILGIEAAAALARRGAEVTLLEGHGWLMPRQLNKAAGELLSECLETLGVRVRYNSRTEAILGETRVHGVQLEGGNTIPADLVLIATGIRPNSNLARKAGLEVNHGVVVDNFLTTSHPDVLAAGDIAEHRGVSYGLWNPARFQGTIAGMNLAGVSAEFGGMAKSTTLKVVGLSLVSVGQFRQEDASYQAIEQRAEGRYSLFVAQDGRLVGAILAGATRAAAAIEKAVEDRIDISGLLMKHATADEVTEYLSESAG